MSGIRGFGRQNVAHQTSSYFCGDNLIVDRRCNVFANDLTVRKTATIVGDLFVEGNITGNNISSQQLNHLTELYIIPTGTTGTVVIPPTSETDVIPSTVLVTKCPCRGSIVFIDPISGEITYQIDGNTATVSLDAYQYSILNSFSVPITVTQLLCTPVQSFVMPPMLNNGCVDFTDFSPSPYPVIVGPLDLASLAMQGEYPIDWSTLTFSNLDSYTLPFNGVGFCFLNSTYPYGTNISPRIAGPGVPSTEGVLTFTGAGPSIGETFVATLSHDNNGMVILTLTNPTGGEPSVGLQYFIRGGVQVEDTQGNLSNVATIYLANVVLL
jgi:hypothetical protein